MIYLYDSSGKKIEGVGLNLFPDNTPRIKLSNDALNHTQHIVVTYHTLLEFYSALYIADTITRIDPARELTLGLPFLPGARQDKPVSENDSLYLAQSIAEDINARGFDRVWSIDSHSDVMPKMIKNFVNIPLCQAMFPDYITKAYEYNYAYYICPDIGARERVRSLVHQVANMNLYGYKIPAIIQCEKKRHPVTGEVSLTLPEINLILSSEKILVVDDICDGGATFVAIAKGLKQIGAERIDLLVTHGIFSRGIGHLRDLYGEIMATDSMSNSIAGVKYINIVQDIVRFKRYL